MTSNRSGDQHRDGDGRARRFDLAQRTAVLGERIIGFAKTIPRNEITPPLISQLVRSGASVGSNYCEADEADSKKEFRYRIGVCKREARETRFHLRMLVAAEPTLREEASRLWTEAKELTLIFSAILGPRRPRNSDAPDQDT